MATKSVYQKLHIKPGHRVLPMSLPADVKAKLDELPKGAKWVRTAVPPVDCVLLFVKSVAELVEKLNAAGVI